MPDSIKKLIESFKMLPGIGEKTAERLAFSVLDFDEDQIKLFSDSISLVNKNIHKCSICNTLTENDVCFVMMIVEMTVFYVLLMMLKMFFYLKKWECLMAIIMF